MTEDRLILRPVARMVKILGEHLIRDNTVGVMELIKNGYDADAEKVTVELKNISDPIRTEIIIEDDGTGMDEATIKGPWSEPAHGGKQSEKDELKPSKKGRLPLGEKGVGRFASQKLGRYLEMVTRPEGSDVEYHVNIDWNIFDKDNSYLDEIGFPLEKKSPQVFTGTKHGTRLVIKEARTPWKKQDVEKLQASLIRLLSPTNSIQNFSVDFKCDEYPELENLDRGDILSKYQFKIDCTINEKGRVSYKYYSRNSDGKEEEISVDDMNLWSQVNEDWEKYDPTCGTFRVIICAWLRGAENLEKYGITRIQLSNLAGMSIYRDGFRILPYGDFGDDWLGLDLRRTNQPGEKYGNNQIIGQVEITQEKNRCLTDKTNREGLQENEAYFDMRDLVLGVLSLIETESLEARSSMKKTTETTKTLRTKVDELTKKIEELKAQPQKTVVVEEPESVPTGVTKTLPPTKTEVVVEVPVEKLTNLEEQARVVDTSITEAIKEFAEVKEEKREAFLHLMGMGLSAERFSHEFDRMVASLSGNIKSLEDQHPYDRRIKALRIICDSLKNEVALMSAARFVRRQVENPEVKVRDVIAMSLAAHASYIDDNKIQIEYADGDDFIAKISTASLSQVLDNVIANATYWLNVKTEINDRKLSIVVNATSKTITISNNGSKIAPNIKRALFLAPFVTSKPDGRGLGLYICHEILKRNNASIEFLSEDNSENKYKSAAFKITFH
ncbi:MAG: ATP-binding protein [Candidatus Nitrosotenuis sp.]|nr:ATP-binding protein [Candidatus Nitrosotenuis sp.]